MLNIVIPMAGAGSRFAKAGYPDPKPLIPIYNTPMIRVVIENLRPICEHRFIFIVQKEHAIRYDLKKLLNQASANSEVIEIEGITEGAACTVLSAKSFIDNAHPLMIANSDQYIDCNINYYLEKQAKDLLDGIIMTMEASDPKWSFVGLDKTNKVTHVVEKEVISNEATVGIYNFSRGHDFVRAAERMIKLNQRVNNEFYVAPVYNELINEGQKIGIYNIGSEGNGMYGLGTPSDLDAFLNLPLSKQAVESII